MNTGTLIFVRYFREEMSVLRSIFIAVALGTVGRPITNGLVEHSALPGSHRRQRPRVAPDSRTGPARSILRGNDREPAL